MMQNMNLESPYCLKNDKEYLKWRQQRLNNYPVSLSQLVVPVLHLSNPLKQELGLLFKNIQNFGFSLFETQSDSQLNSRSNRQNLVTFAKQLGLQYSDQHLCVGQQDVSTIEISSDKTNARYIPYTHKPILWHTDGYYNDADNQICSLLLFCQKPALQGGLNAVLDHHILYIQLRDKNPEYIKALMQVDAMTIPENTLHQRPRVSGPVFSVIGSQLHMRYTRRTKSIIWKEDPLLTEALRYLELLLDEPSVYHFEVKLKAGQGLIGQNPLHNRTGFEPDSLRKVYRIRYTDLLIH